MKRKSMQLVNKKTGRMECKNCGAIHYANVRPDSNGSYYQESWQCRNGC